MQETSSRYRKKLFAGFLQVNKFQITDLIHVLKEFNNGFGKKPEKYLQVACVNLASYMTNILLEHSDHEYNANSNSEKGQTIICEYVDIFLDCLEHQRFEYGDDVTHSILLQHVHTLLDYTGQQGYMVILHLQEKLS